MTEETEQHFRKAADCVEDSQILLANDRPDAAVARAYYAMFHAATAVLAVKGIKRSSHRGILSAFGEYLVKPGLSEACTEQGRSVKWIINSTLLCLSLP